MSREEKVKFHGSESTTTIPGQPLCARTRFHRLVTAIPEERSLWQSLYYFPYSATWDEPGQKNLAVQHVQALFEQQYIDWYVKSEMNYLLRYQLSPPPPPPQQQQQQQPVQGAACVVRKRQTLPQAWTKNKKRSSQHHQHNRSNRRQRHYDDEEEDEDDDGYDDERSVDHDDLAHVVARSSLQTKTNDNTTLRQRFEAQARQHIQPYLSFLHTLPECEPMTAGFLLLPVGGEGSSSLCCFCPCSRRLRRWRNNNNIIINTTGGSNNNNNNTRDSPLPLTQIPECDANRNSTASVFTPSGLVAHLQADKKRKERGDWWHWLIDEYLRQLFRNYMGPDQPHKAFIRDTKRYKALERSEYLSLRAHIKSLSESEEAYKQQLAASQHREEQLGSECKFLLERLDRERRSETAVRSILAASWESFSPVELSMDELHHYQSRRDDYFYMLRKSLSAEKLSSGICLSVSQEKFDLQSIFQANPSLFLNDLSEVDAAKWMCQLEIQYKAPEMGRKLKTKLQQDLSAIDRGGPTRQFLSDAFRSLDRLAAKHNDKQTTLWSRDEKTGFYFPKEDDTILDELGLWRMSNKPSSCNNRDEALEMAKTIVRPIARAVGRLIFYCLANVVEKDDEYQEHDQRLYVDTYVLPEIYLYYLLMGVKPSSQDYPLGDLAKFLCTHRLPKGNLEGKEGDEFDFRWAEDKDFEKTKERLKSYISVVLDELPQEDRDLYESIHQLRDVLRKAAEKDLIDNRQLVLLALQEGMSLNKGLKFHTGMVVGRAPVEVVRRMFLSRPSCNVEDVIDCLEPRYTGTDEFPENMTLQERVHAMSSQRRLLQITDTGERKGLLPDVLRIMCRSDPDVAGTFVLFATGMRCTPYQDNAYRILVEFTFSSKTGTVTDDMLPWTHTCPRDVMIPGFAYHGDAVLLQEKLSKVLEYANFFNME